MAYTKAPFYQGTEGERLPTYYYSTAPGDRK